MTPAEPAWSVAARRQIAGRRLVVAGIGTGQLRGFAAAGAEIAGAIAVRPAGSAPPCGGAEPFPVLDVAAGGRDILEVVVRGFSEALLHRGDAVASFLDLVDPAREATVASYLPLPHALLGGRSAWAQDSAVASRLETKEGAARALAKALRVVPSVALPEGPPSQWWDGACERLGSRRLVVQAPGLSAGGTGTWVCDGPAAVPELASGRVMPYLEGPSANVLGVALEGGGTVVLPASRQLVSVAGDGHPLYGGNVTGEEWATRERDAIRSDVAALGEVLATEGFVGPFGVDFLRTPSGRLYHDLNPRMNGALDNLSFLMDGDGTVPMVPLLLSRTPWSPGEAAQLEDAAHASARMRPLARLWLTVVLRRPRLVQRVPPAGAWRINPDLSVSPVAGSARGADVAVLHPIVQPGHFRAGDRLVLGDLFCEPGLTEAIGPGGGPDLIDAFLA